MVSVSHEMFTKVLLAFTFAAFAAFAQPSPPYLTRAEAALIIAEHFHLQHSQDPHDLYGLFQGIFPGGYDGTANFSYYDKPLTTEVLTVVLVRQAGWDVIHYDHSLAAKVSNFVSPDGFPYYGPEPTPRSIPYITVALEHRLLTREELPDLKRPIGTRQLHDFLTRIDNVQLNVNPRPTELLLNRSAVSGKRIDKIPPHSGSELIVVPRGMPSGSLPAGLTNPVLDFRAPNPRLFSGPSSLSTGNQDYFPLGALDTTFTVAQAIPKDSLAHQGQALYGLVENQSSTVNAVGIWGASESRGPRARVWGSFFTANSSHGDANDAQLIGSEIDVVNYTKPGVSPNESKTGIQVVGIGSAPVTNAIEIIGFDRGVWTNGILFSEHSVSESGTFIGLRQKTPANIGIDMSQTPFRNGAMVISNNSLVALRSKSGGNAGLYADDIGNGSLVLRSGRDGTRITDNTNSKNVLWIRPDGSLDSHSSLIKFYRPYVWLVVAFVVLLAAANVFLCFWNMSLVREMRKLRSPGTP